MGKKGDDKKAKVNGVSTVEPVAPDTSAAAVVPPASAGAAGPVAALNSVQQVQREYSFNPERYSDAYTDSGSFWAVSSSEQRDESSVRVSCSCGEASICCPRWRRWQKPWPKSCSGFHASRQVAPTPAAAVHRKLVLQEEGTVPSCGGSQKTGSPGGGHSSKAGGGAQETGSLEYIQYKGGGGQMATRLVAFHRKPVSLISSSGRTGGELGVRFRVGGLSRASLWGVVGS